MQNLLKPRFLFLFLFLFAMAGESLATVLYWDPEGTTVTAAPNGTWTGGAQWSTTSALTASPVIWTNGVAACFAAGTAVNGTLVITLTNTQIIGGIFNGPFAPPGCFLTLTGSGALSLVAGQDGIDSAGSDGGTTTINVPLIGPGQVVVEGSCQLYLNGTNTYTGGTQLGFSSTVFSGTVNFNNPSSFGTGTITTYSPSCNVAVEGVLPITITNPWVATAVKLNLIGNPAGVTFSGPWNLTATPTLGSGGSNLVIISGVMSGAGGLNKWNPGTLKLTATNTYTGATTISNGSLALGLTGFINNSASLTIAPSATLDVSENPNYVLGGSTTLLAAGTGTAPNTSAIIKGASGGSVSLGSRPVILNYTPTAFAGDTTHPPLYLSQGALSLNNNTIVISNLAATALGAGTYRLIQVGDGSTGVITGTPNSTFVIRGTGLAAGTSAILLVTNGNLNLVVKPAPVFTNFFTSDIVNPGIGVTNVIFSGKISGPGPVYPVQGETIAVNLNGKSLTATVTDNTGDFSCSFDPATITYSTNVYPITLTYAGDASIAASTNSISNLVANTYYVGDALPGFISGMNLFFTNQPNLKMFAWSSTNPALPVASWTLEGPMDELGVNDGTGRSRYSINVNPASTLVYYIMGQTNLWPYATPTAVQWLTTADFVDYAFFMTNTTITVQGILGLPAAPVIVRQPAAQTTVLLGQTVILSTAVTGSTPLSYQWFFNTNTPLAGMTNASLVFTNASTNLVGLYNVVVTNQYGSVTSTYGNLSVMPTPRLTGTNIVGGFQWSGTAVSNETYWVQSTTNLIPPIIWTSLITNQAGTNGNFSFSDTNILNNSSKFYRVVFP